MRKRGGAGDTKESAKHLRSAGRNRFFRFAGHGNVSILPAGEKVRVVRAYVGEDAPLGVWYKTQR